MLNLLPLSPERGARLLVFAMRSLGDLPGHEFHGNQWTGGLGTVSPTELPPLMHHTCAEKAAEGVEVALLRHGIQASWTARGDLGHQLAVYDTSILRMGRPRPRSLGGAGSGNFGHEGRPGEVGGSSTDGLGVAKVKSAPATKEQISTALEMRKAGASYADIKAKTGLNEKQAATIVHKARKAEATVREALGSPPPIAELMPAPPTPAPVDPLEGHVINHAAIEKFMDGRIGPEGNAFATPRDGIVAVHGALRKAGIDVPKKVPQEMPFDRYNKSISGDQVAGWALPNGNYSEVAFSPDTLRGIAKGDHEAITVVIHEHLHTASGYADDVKGKKSWSYFANNYKGGGGAMEEALVQSLAENMSKAVTGRPSQGRPYKSFTTALRMGLTQYLTAAPAATGPGSKAERHMVKMLRMRTYQERADYFKEVSGRPWQESM